jgi:MFS family permease
VSEPLPADADERYEETEISVETPPAHRPRGGFGPVLHNRAFLSLWSAQIASQTAQNTLWYVLIILVSNLTGTNPASIGLTIILVQLPTVLFSSVSGVLVDRVSKRFILVSTNIIRVGGVLGYFLLQTHVEGLYLVTFAVAVVSQPFAPAEGATIPLVVKDDQLITANSLFQVTFAASQAVGFAVGPIAIGLLGIPTTLLVLAGLFAFAAIVLIPLPARTRRAPKSNITSTVRVVQGVVDDLKEVARYILHDRPLLTALFQIALAPTLLLLLAEVGPNFLKQSLGIGNTGTSLFFLLAPAGVGLGLGIFVLGRYGNRLRKDRLVLVSLIALGVTVIGLASVPGIAAIFTAISTAFGLPIPEGVRYIAAIIPVSALLGIEVAFINAPVQTIVQERAPPALRGRVLALQQTLTAAIAIPPLVLVGGIAALISTPATLALMGLFMVAAGLAMVYHM